MHLYKNKDILRNPWHKLQHSQDKEFIKNKSFAKRKKRDWQGWQTHPSTEKLHANKFDNLKTKERGNDTNRIYTSFFYFFEIFPYPCT